MWFKRKTIIALCLGITILLVTLFFMVNYPNLPRTDEKQTPHEATETQPAQATPSADAAPASGAQAENSAVPEPGSSVAHNLPKEEPLPDSQYTTHFAKWEFACDCKPRTSASGALTTAQAGEEASADGQDQNGQTDANLLTGADADLDNGDCGGFPAEMDSDLLAKLEALRTALGRPVVITSGIRCEKCNAAVGGIANSRHLTGRAADLYCPGVHYSEVARVAREQGLWVLEYPNEAYCHVEV